MNLSLKIYTRAAVFYLFSIALLGVFLRFGFIKPIPFSYRNILHTHSHIALLGWVYSAIILLLYHLFIRKKALNRKRFFKIFIATQITIIGMFIRFPMEGYAFFSILFSSLFLICSYWFFIFFIKRTEAKTKMLNSYKLAKSGLIYLTLSSLGPWSLGAIMLKLGASSPLYKNAIYFYLHFQYNGWITVLILSFFFYLLEKSNIQMSSNVFKRFSVFLHLSILLTFLISILWMKPPIFVYGIAVGGSILQIIAFGILLKFSLLCSKQLNQALSNYQKMLLKFLVFIFVSKLVMQLLGASPNFANSIALDREVIVGYLHWNFLGIGTLGLLFFLNYYKLLELRKVETYLFIFTFFATEGLLFYKGLVLQLGVDLMENYFLYLFLTSCLFVISTGIIFVRNLRS